MEEPDQKVLVNPCPGKLCYGKMAVSVSSLE